MEGNTNNTTTNHDLLKKFQILIADHDKVMKISNGELIENHEHFANLSEESKEELIEILKSHESSESLHANFTAAYNLAHHADWQDGYEAFSSLEKRKLEASYQDENRSHTETFHNILMAHDDNPENHQKYFEEKRTILQDLHDRLYQTNDNDELDITAGAPDPYTNPQDSDGSGLAPTEAQGSPETVPSGNEYVSRYMREQDIMKAINDAAVPGLYNDNKVIATHIYEDKDGYIYSTSYYNNSAVWKYNKESKKVELISGPFDEIIPCGDIYIAATNDRDKDIVDKRINQKYFLLRDGEIQKEISAENVTKYLDEHRKPFEKSLRIRQHEYQINSVEAVYMQDGNRHYLHHIKNKGREPIYTPNNENIICERSNQHGALLRDNTNNHNKYFFINNQGQRFDIITENNSTVSLCGKCIFFFTNDSNKKVYDLEGKVIAENAKIDYNNQCIGKVWNKETQQTTIIETATGEIKSPPFDEIVQTYVAGDHQIYIVKNGEEYHQISVINEYS